MADLVVLVLVVLWAAVLTPRLIRHFRDGRSHSSIESFHEQLHLLERTGPKLVEPAYRLESNEVVARRSSRAASLDANLAIRSSRGLTLLDTPDDFDDAPDLTFTPNVRPDPRASPRFPSPSERARRRRRRDFLLLLVALTALTGGLGAMHALHLLWAVTGVTVLAIAGYVALVAYAQMLHAENEATKPIGSYVPEGPVSPWALTRPKHAAGSPLPGVEVLTGSTPLAARAGYPGAWDEELVSLAPRHAAGG